MLGCSPDVVDEAANKAFVVRPTDRKLGKWCNLCMYGFLRWWAWGGGGEMVVLSCVVCRGVIAGVM